MYRILIRAATIGAVVLAVRYLASEAYQAFIDEDWWDGRPERRPVSGGPWVARQSQPYVWSGIASPN